MNIGVLSGRVNEKNQGGGQTNIWYWLIYYLESNGMTNGWGGGPWALPTRDDNAYRHAILFPK